jgi:hypothetical protein
MRNNLLHIKLLKFLVENSKSFGFVETKPFLLKHFPQEPKLRERIKMKEFLKFLSSEEYIEVRDKRGIWIIREAGKDVERNEVSAIVKIKPKGVNLVEQNELNRYNKNGIILSSILGITTLLLGFYGLFITFSITQLEKENSKLDKENTILKSSNEQLEFYLNQDTSIKKDSILSKDSKIKNIELNTTLNSK